MDNEIKEEVKPEEKKDFLSEAREIAARNEKAVEEMRKLTERNEELAARNLLGGKSLGGLETPKPVEESATEYARRMLTGRI